MSENSDKKEDGFVNVNGLNLYYVRFGKGNRYKLLTLHGGPGGTHDYLLPLSDLAGQDFDIVFYDQFGCGKSDDPKNESDYSLEYAVEEVDGVRKALFGDDKVHLFGSSWGGMLALAYTLKHQDHLKSVTTSSGLASVSETVKEMHRLISQLPDKEREAIEKHEADGDYSSPEYQEAAMYFMKKHLLRWDEWPREVADTMEVMEKRGTYLKMNGPSEFTIIGTIKDVDFKDDLHTIKIPALITCGRHDEVTPEIAKSIHDRIGGSQMEVFENSAHMQFWEERDKYLEVLSEFIRKND
ncbi:proline iminopeptidase [uncultured archaeon]|nr:proline iminopeptidase [uncultured archaeon]